MSQDPRLPDKIKLSAADHARNTLMAALQGVPYIGSALSQFIFGPLTELRFKRIEKTLAEVAEAIQHEGAASPFPNEEFVALLEAVMPELARATDEHLRTRYRDLLLKASHLEPGSPLWQDATLCAELLRTIEPPGITVLGALARSPTERNTLFSKPTSRLFGGEVDLGTPPEQHTPLPYDWLVVEEWVYRLKEKRLIGLSSGDARGGFGGVYLTDLGRFFIEWVGSAS
jgi:hypothetical protein